MQILRGQKVSEGIATGRCTVITTAEVRVREARVTPEKVESEIRKFRRALARTEQDIRALLEAQNDDLVDVRQIIETSLHFLLDDYLIGSIETKIRNERHTAAYAVSRTIAEMAERLQAIDNPTFSSKVSDMIDLEHRMLNHIVGTGLGQIPRLDRPCIIIADDITPTQAASLDREKVLGFATERGSWASHTAILARALGIPAVVGVPGIAKAVAFGANVIIDGYEGQVLVDPDHETVERYRNARRRVRRQALSATHTRSLRGITQDGEVCKLNGNIETKADVPRVLEFGGDGVGLFRTEFLFLGRRTAPTEEEQYETYREAIVGMKGRPVTIRSIDVGGDKFDPVHAAHTEPNPFMGERSIRVSLKRLETFRVQLRAILRATAHGPIRLMFPLISDVGEFRRAREQVEAAKAELDARGVAYDPAMPVGTMIELPSAALNAARLAREADFFSVGTNDLTQYTLGVDRTNQRVAHLYASHHPSVLALLRLVLDAGAAAGRSVGICGEMAGDVRYTALLLGLGFRRLSASPPQIPKVKKAVRALTIARCRELAEAALACEDARQVLDLIEAFDR